MSTGEAGTGVGGGLMPSAHPYRIGTYQGTTAFRNASFGNAFSGTALLLGVDAAATDAEPIQCFLALGITGCQWFYTDSQSTGEGLGVRWTWRGQIPIYENDVFYYRFSASGPINFGITAWGTWGNWIAP